MPIETCEGDPFDALADPHRRAILEILTSGDHSVRELAEALPISRPAVSRHLRLLKLAGMVKVRNAGTQRLYRLDRAGAVAISGFLGSIWGQALDTSANEANRKARSALPVS